MNRRYFLGVAASAAVSGSHASANLAANKVVVGVMGMGGRGNALAKVFSKQAAVEVAYVCDPDERKLGQAASALAKTPKAVGDFRRMLDDKSVDAIVVTTCNHWHAPATIHACNAGKHVYVEKPCSHNPREGELMVEAAKKHSRQVQMGNQRRSSPKIIEAMEVLHKGELGRVYFSQSWYTNTRSSIGQGKKAPVPQGLDFDLWQGPAARRPYQDNLHPYNWHWFWHYGNGELGNNGIHFIDLSRWGLQVEYPEFVNSVGGRYRYEDDQQTPDTHFVSFAFGGRKSIAWEGYSCNTLPEGRGMDVLFQGEKGSLAILGGGYSICDPKGKVIRKEKGPDGEALHIDNFIQAVRGEGKLNSPISEGHKSTLLCHLGNIAQRAGQSVVCDPNRGGMPKDAKVHEHWSREYAPGWEPRVS